MVDNVQIVLRSEDWIDDTGEKMVFKIPFEQLVLMLKKSVQVIAKEDLNPLRLYASNTYTSLKLMLAAMNEDDVKESPKKIDAPVKKKKRVYKGRVCGMRPSDEVLLDFKKSGFLHKKVAKLYGVKTSTVSNWYTKIKKGK